MNYKNILLLIFQISVLMISIKFNMLEVFIGGSIIGILIGIIIMNSKKVVKK